jgi:superfamily II DNA or RNA helicase
MSVYVPVKHISPEFNKILCNELVVTPKESDYGDSLPLDCYDVFSMEDKTSICIPLYYYNTHRDTILDPSEVSTVISDEKKYPPHSGYTFKGELKPKQLDIRTKCLRKLNKYNTLLLSLGTGGGKTVITIYLAYKIGLKTCVMAHRKFLIDQWKDRIYQFAPMAKVQILHAKTKMDLKADIYIMNIDTVHKKEYGFFSDIGVMVIDEAHLSCSPGRLKAYFKFAPKYLICLTATPDERPDTLDDQIFGLYVGKKARVHSPLWREHNVYKFDTGFFPHIKYSRSGKLDWTDIIKQQSENTKRNDSIVKVIRYFDKINFIVLCKRVLQAKYIYSSLKDAGECVDIYTGEHNTYNFNTRILISSFSKTGVGFDWVPTTPDGQPLDMGLIVASDIMGYFLQYLGRVFRSDKSPIVIDFVDRFKPMINHWQVRTNNYQSVGGNIQNFHTVFTDFPMSCS